MVLAVLDAACKAIESTVASVIGSVEKLPNSNQWWRRSAADTAVVSEC